MQDFSASSHVLLRLRLLHPVAAVVGSIYVLWVLWRFWWKQDRSQWTLVLAITLTAQIAFGAMNVILLAPVWLQMTHLLVADLFWILLVLASADLLFADRHFSVSHAQKTKSEVTWDLVFK
jgi:heme A synthase